MTLEEAVGILENLAHQRENQAIVSLGLRDGRAIRLALKELERQRCEIDDLIAERLF